MPEFDTPIGGMVARFHPPRLHPDISLRALCGVLVVHDVDVAIIEAPGTPISLVTAADVVRAVARGASLDHTSAGGIAPARPARLFAGTPAISAVATMADEGATHALVLDEDGLVGTASLLDVVRHLFAHTKDGQVTS